MNCEKATELVSLNCEQPIGFINHIALRWHLHICPKCRYFQQNILNIKQMLHHYANLDEQASHSTTPTDEDQ